LAQLVELELVELAGLELGQVVVFRRELLLEQPQERLLELLLAVLLVL
jgi:hypothetical protein